MRKTILSLFFFGLVITTTVDAVQPKWERWDTANSVAKEGNWLVIRQPEEGFCYIKQGYDGYADKMELIVKKSGIPILISPFFRGIESNIEYWVDSKKLRTISPSQVLKLSKELIPELKKGNYLYIEFKPVGHRAKKQKFSLLGFTKAHSWLGSSECRKKVAEKF